MAEPCCERGEPTGGRHVCEGVGSGIPTRIRGDRIAGAISGCRGESCPAETALFAPSLHRAFAGHSIWLQSGYMKKRKVVISWIQLYPDYNHFRNLKIPSRFLNLLPVKFAKHCVFASPKVSPIDCINEGVCKIP